MFSEKRQKQTKNARSIRETQKSFPFQEEGALRRYVLSESMRNWLIKIDLDGQNTIYSLQDKTVKFGYNVFPQKRRHTFWLQKYFTINRVTGVVYRPSSCYSLYLFFCESTIKNSQATRLAVLGALAVLSALAAATLNIQELELFKSSNYLRACMY